MPANDGDAAVLFDHVEAVRAVPQRAGQDDADHARPEVPGGRAKQRVDCGTEAVFARTVADSNAGRCREEVEIGPRDVNVSGFDGRAVHGG